MGPEKSGTYGTAATTQIHVGGGSDQRVRSLRIAFEYSSSPACDASITIKGKPTAGAQGDQYTLLALGFKDNQTGANSTSAITASKSVLVDASGMDVFLDVTTLTTGSFDWTALPLLG